MRKLVLLVFAIPLAGAVQATAITAAEVQVKKAIADTMTAEELAAYKQRLADRVNQGLLDKAPATPPTPADTCAAATPQIGVMPINYPVDTTVGQVDDYDLPADTTNPTCSVGATCTGAGPAGSLPMGAIYTGTGTAPDRAYRFVTDINCTMTFTLDPTGAEDLSLIVYQANCSSSLADCACVDDTGVGGVAESVTLSAIAGVTYFVVIDGYSTGATPPGPSGPFTLSLTGPTSCWIPVELQTFTVED